MDFDKDAKKLITLCWLSYMVNYLARYGLSTAMSDMADSGLFSITFAGVIGTAFLAAYGIGQFVNGMTGDRIHPKTMIFAGLVGSAVMNLLVGISNNATVILVLWCLNGFFCSMLWAPIVRSFSEFLTKDHRTKAGMWISSSIPAGNILSYLSASVILKYLQWRFVFIISGMAVLVMAFVWYVGNASLKSYLKQVKITKEDEIKAQSHVTKNVFASKNLIHIIVATGIVYTLGGIFFNGILKEGVTLWVPTFITQYFKKDASIASFVTMILPIFNLVGVFLAVRLYRYIVKNEMTTAGIMFLISTAAFIMLYFFGKSGMLFSIILIAFSTAAMLGVNTMFLTFIPLNFSSVKKSATITGILNAISYTASSMSSVIIGLLTGLYGWDTTILSWILIAVLGALVSFLGAKPWQKGKEMLAN